MMITRKYNNNNSNKEQLFHYNKFIWQSSKEPVGKSVYEFYIYIITMAKAIEKQQTIEK